MRDTRPGQVKAMGISDFRETDWPRWLAIDPDFQPSYQSWRAKMDKQLPQLAAQGIRCEPVLVDPDAFLAWSKVHLGGKVDTHARGAYVAAEMARRAGG